MLPGRLCSGVPHGDEAAVAVGLARVFQQVGQIARLQQRDTLLSNNYVESDMLTFHA